MNLKKELGGVADAVTKIMNEALKGNQHKIDANKNDKVDAHDFKLLRAKKEVKKEEVEQIDESDLGNGYKVKMKHIDKGRIHSPSGEHVADVTRHESGWQYHSGNSKWDGTEKSPHYKTGVEKTKMAAAKKAAQIHMNEQVELTQDEAEMLASLSQEEFDSLTEEERDLFIEYFQPLNEISTGAAKNYLKKAVSSSSKLNQKSAKPGEDAAAEHDYSHGNDPYETPQFEKFSRRRTGIRKAITKLASAHPDNKKLATTARQAFNRMHNANYRIGMDGAKNHPKDVKHVKQQHAIIHKAVHAMKEKVEQIDELSKEKYKQYLGVSKKEIKKHNTGSQLSRYGNTAGDRGFKQAGKNYQDRELNTQKAQDYAKKKVEEKVESVEEGYYKNMDTNRKEDERLAAQKKKEPPFTPDKPGKKIATAGKYGYGYSAARHLARKGMASLTKEEQEFIDELNKSTLGNYIKRNADDQARIGYINAAAQHDKTTDRETKNKILDRSERQGINRDIGLERAVKRLTKEEQEFIDEDITKTATGYIHHARPGVYGGSAKEKHVVDTLKGPKKSELNAIEKEKKMKKSFSEMLDLINSQGLKALSEMIKEEPDNETFTKELKDQEAKAAGKKKQPDIAKGSIQAVKVEEEVEQVEERSLTEPEMEKKEEIVKSMKKGLAGFKERYGDRAKEVMYATATKQAKGE